MKNNKNQRKTRKLFALLCASCMLATTVVGLASCKKPEKPEVDDSEVSITEKDDARIQNNKFEIFDDNDGKNLIITSPSGWTKSVASSTGGSAVSSKTASGIVDTDAEKWEVFTATSELPHSTLEEAEENWENLTTRDKLEFISTWTEESSQNKVKDLPFYDEEDDIFHYNVDFEDLPDCENPGVHPDAEEDETNVLMLHNHYTDTWGTAQKYTSSSTVTLKSGTTATLSVWVKTANLTYGTTAGGSQAVVDGRGAYIGVTNTVAGTTLEQVQVKNIIADEWQQYTFYLTACNYADTTFTLVLGLGQGAGNKWEYVDGYAFFDDVECTVRPTKDFDYSAADEEVTSLSSAEDVKFHADEEGYEACNYIHINHATHMQSLDGEYTNPSNFANIEQTIEVSNGITFTSGITNTQKDITGVFTKDELAAKTADNDYFEAFYNKELADSDFASNYLLLFSKSGAPYTAPLGKDFTLAKDEYKLISFWFKSSDLSGGFIGANVKLTCDGEVTDAFTNLSSASTVKVDIDDGEGGKVKDVFGGWQQYLIFVKNEGDEAKNYQLSFTYGPTAIATTLKDDYRDGAVVFANFEEASLTKKEFSRVSTSLFANIIDLTDEQTATSVGFDSPATVPTDAIESGFANPMNFDGVYGGSNYVVWNGTSCEKNAYEYAGLLSSDYASNYALSTNYSSAVKTAIANALDDATTPLVIYNDDSLSYGYFGGKKKIAANSYETIALRVKASEGAIANIYLMENSDTGYHDALTINAPKYTYWYDEDGNICGKDPSKNFNAKRDIAFKRNAQGLYEVNKNWTGYSEDLDGKLFANLDNYEVDPATGNLLVAKGGVEYNYDSSKWEHAGNNGIAFYAKDNEGTMEYYAYADYTTRVYSFSSVANLTPRHDNSTKNGLVLSKEIVGSGDGEWVEVYFYIHTGAQAKDYRLEVWSGSRDGSVKSAAGSYVAFDVIDWKVDQTSFTNLLNEKVEELKDANGWATDDEFKSNYSGAASTTFNFFDSAKFLRYDETLDKENVGNSYDDYNPTTHTEGYAYLSYDDGVRNQSSFFVDYSVVDVLVSVDADATVDSDHDHDHDHEGAATSDNGMNIWLLASSLLLAGVLLITVISLILRKLLKKRHKAVRVQNSYRRTHAPKKVKKEKKVEKTEEVEEVKDENDPYND